MKIFFPLEVFYPSQAGGTANTVYALTKQLALNGFESIIVSTDMGVDNGVPKNAWHTTESGKVIFVKTRFSYFPFSHLIVSLLNFFRADIVHISSVFFPTAFITGFAARLLKKRLVWSVHGELDKYSLNYSRFRKAPFLWGLKNLIGKYPLYHSTCDEETQFIKNVISSDVRIAQIPNYIDIAKEVARNPSNYLLYIGRIHPKKAIDHLIRALALSDKFCRSNFVLCIAGKGKSEHEAELKRLVAELNLSGKVIFKGQIEGDAKQQLFADAYFTIMPSHTENFGMVVLESLSQNTPVIASKGTPWRSLEKERIGFWTDNSPESISKLIDQILKMSADDYEDHRSRCRGFVIERFGIHENIGKWIDVYNNLK